MMENNTPQPAMEGSGALGVGIVFLLGVLLMFFMGSLDYHNVKAERAASIGKRVDLSLSNIQSPVFVTEQHSCAGRMMDPFGCPLSYLPSSWTTREWLQFDTANYRVINPYQISAICPDLHLPFPYDAPANMTAKTLDHLREILRETPVHVAVLELTPKQLSGTKTCPNITTRPDGKLQMGGKTLASFIQLRIDAANE